MWLNLTVYRLINNTFWGSIRAFLMMLFIRCFIVKVKNSLTKKWF